MEETLIHLDSSVSGFSCSVRGTNQIPESAPPKVLKVAIVSYDAEDYKPNFDKKVSTPFVPLSKFFAILSELGEAFVLLSFAPPWAI